MASDVEVAEFTALDQLKQQNYERSRRQGHIELIGPLGGLTPSALWTGGISLEQRLRSGEVTKAEIEELTGLLPSLFVPTTLGAPIGCIDGRGIDGYDDNDPVWYSRPLGPKVPGGTPLQAIVRRLTLSGGNAAYQAANLRADFKDAKAAAAQAGYSDGDHIDDHHTTRRTGCGAIDGVEKHCNGLWVAVNEIEPATGLLLGNGYNQSYFDATLANTARLMGNPHYFEAKNDILAEMIRNNPHSVPRLIKQHAEFAVIVNFVKGTTLHSDHLNALTKANINAFCFDAWHTVDMGVANFPGDKAKQSQYVHARVALGLSALMDLTDGTPLLMVRNPTEVLRAA